MAKGQILAHALPDRVQALLRIEGHPVLDLCPFGLLVGSEDAHGSFLSLFLDHRR
jgi:hypothetical protein